MAIETKRATVYLEPEILRALKLKAHEGNRSVSELVNEAVRATLAEDAADLYAFAVRDDESAYPFAELVRDLERRGRL